MIRIERKPAMEMKPGEQFIRNEAAFTVKEVWVDSDGEDGEVTAVCQGGDVTNVFHFGEGEEFAVVVEES